MSRYLTTLLELIQTVNNNYRHIVEFEQLEILLKNCKENIWYTKEDIEFALIVAKTTHNSHYNYKLFLNEAYQDPKNHVDVVLVDKPLLTTKVTR